MIKKLCVISTRYPSKTDPIYAFLGALIEQFADRGIECHVISPVSFTERKHRASSRVEITSGGERIYVHCPRFMKLPQAMEKGFLTVSFSAGNRRRAVWRAYKRNVGDCDAFYSHFLESGNDAAYLKKKTGKPAFVACGESNIRRNELIYTLYRDDIYDGFDGIVYVSSAIKSDAEKLDVFSEAIPTAVFPNGVNSEIFRPYDRTECRKKLNVAEDDYVIAFVGTYIKRKGFDKLQEILLRHPSWKCILIGSGDIPLKVPDSQVVFAGEAEHDKIPQIINAADVFVLPTLAEGCCNAIVEALACALPVISSDRPFNDDILDESCSVRIDPENTDEIASAIERLENDRELRKSLSEGALRKSAGMNLKTRADRIIRFMEECIQNGNKMSES